MQPFFQRHYTCSMLKILRQRYYNAAPTFFHQRPAVNSAVTNPCWNLSCHYTICCKKRFSLKRTTLIKENWLGSCYDVSNLSSSHIQLGRKRHLPVFSNVLCWYLVTSDETPGRHILAQLINSQNSIFVTLHMYDYFKFIGVVAQIPGAKTIRKLWTWNILRMIHFG